MIPQLYESLPMWVLGSNRVNVSHFDFNSSAYLLFYLVDAHSGLSIVNYDINQKNFQLIFKESFNQLFGVYALRSSPQNSIFNPVDIKKINGSCVSEDCNFTLGVIFENFHA